jgi:predicted DNA-binding protein
MSTLQLTQVYLEREQKKRLQARAKANGTKVAEEVRRAIDAYLTGVSAEELRLLDIGTRRAEKHLAEMAGELDRVNAKLDAAFAQLDRQHRKGRQAA